jgi:hypothetical protein
MIRGIVILYDGREATQSDIQTIIDGALFIKDSASVEVTQFSGKSLSGMLLRACKAPIMPKEDGDQSVIVIAGMTDMSSWMSFTQTLINRLTHVDINNDNDRALLKACSFLSKSSREVPVSKEVAKQYEFTEQYRDIVRQFYRVYQNGQNI